MISFKCALIIQLIYNKSRFITWLKISVPALRKSPTFWTHGICLWKLSCLHEWGCLIHSFFVNMMNYKVSITFCKVLWRLIFTLFLLTEIHFLHLLTLFLWQNSNFRLVCMHFKKKKKKKKRVTEREKLHFLEVYVHVCGLWTHMVDMNNMFGCVGVFVYTVGE